LRSEVEDGGLRPQNLYGFGVVLGSNLRQDSKPQSKLPKQEDKPDDK
jgi:hypothetical protein